MRHFFLSVLPTFALLFLITAMFVSCSSVPDTAARRYIEENIKEGNVSFLCATELDSTNRVTPQAMQKLRNDCAKEGNLKANFPKECPKMLYYTMIRYTVTYDNGKVDSVYQTFYMDKEQSIVYGVKNN